MRAAKALITLEFLVDMARQPQTPFVIITENPLPPDAKVVGFAKTVAGDAETGPTVLECIIVSEAFADVPEPLNISTLPILPPTRFRRVEV